MGPGDESKAYGVDGDASNVRREHVIDWLEQASDLPHLIARVSELVLLLGHEPDALVVLPRSELDRRELAAYSAGWADVVDEQLPAIRRAYEERITAAYLQGQEDARTGHRPRRTRRAEAEREHEYEHERGGEVIPLPYVELLRPPSAWARVEERGERERSVADGAPVPAPPPGGGTDGGEEDAYGDPRDPANVVGSASPTSASGPARGAREGDRAVEDKDEDEDEDEGEVAGAGGAEAGSGAEGDILLSAREVRGRRVTSSDRRPVVRRNGRPSVPPLALPGDIGAPGREKARRPDGSGPAERPPQERPPQERPPQERPPQERPPQERPPQERPEQTGRAEWPEPVEPADPQGARDEPRPRLLSDKARALADELEGRAGRRRDEQNGPPDSR